MTFLDRSNILAKAHLGIFTRKWRDCLITNYQTAFFRLPGVSGDDRLQGHALIPGVIDGKLESQARSCSVPDLGQTFIMKWTNSLILLLISKISAFRKNHSDNRNCCYTANCILQLKFNFSKCLFHPSSLIMHVR